MIAVANGTIKTWPIRKAVVSLLLADISEPKWLSERVRNWQVGWCQRSEDPPIPRIFWWVFAALDATLRLFG